MDDVKSQQPPRPRLGPDGAPPGRFADAYKGPAPPWDIGRPQGEIVALADAGAITGAVLDVGCGTGENALFLAARGFEVWGVDAVGPAIEAAREKSGARGLAARFEVGDALALEALGRTFDTVIDSGLFHVFGDAQRPRYAASLARVLPAGGRCYLLCFSEAQGGDVGPRRVTQREIRETFAGGWEVEDIRPAMFEARADSAFADGARAWCATIVRR